MKKYVAGLVVLAVLAGATILLFLFKPDSQVPEIAQPLAPAEDGTIYDIADFPEPSPGAIVFDMKYRGLSGGKDELRYNSYWGFGQREELTPFLAELKKHGKQFTAVYNSHFKGAEWSAVEVKDNKAVAFYFDLNADGKVAENEKILPIEPTDPGSAASRAEFVTPDFTMTTPDGHQVQFRAVLQATFYGQSSAPNCMWSPSCVLEGTSTLGGKPTKLILFASGFPDSFTEFGRSSYALLAGDQKTGQYVSRATLSSLINSEGRYYHLKLQGTHERGKGVRAVLEKCTGPTGQLAVKLDGNSGLEASLSSATLVGSEDNTICFSISGHRSALPAKPYLLNSAYINYGAGTTDQCQVNVTKGPEFKIEADKTCIVELGKPVLSVKAVDERQRYQSDAKERSVFSEDTTVFLTPKIVGKAGELYGRFTRRAGTSGNYEDIEPTIRIVDAAGNEVASAAMEYG